MRNSFVDNLHNSEILGGTFGVVGGIVGGTVTGCYGAAALWLAITSAVVGTGGIVLGMMAAAVVTVAAVVLGFYVGCAVGAILGASVKSLFGLFDAGVVSEPVSFSNNLVNANH